MRKGYFGFVAALAALVLLGAGYQVSKAEPAKHGKIEVKVMKDNKPVANAHVLLFVAEEHHHEAGHDATHHEADNDNHHKNKEEKAIAKGTTNAEGIFIFESEAPGKYIVRAGEKGEGVAQEHVTVTADQTAEVTLNLKMHRDKDHHEHH